VNFMRRIRPLIFRVVNQMAKPQFPDFKKYPQLLETTGHLTERLFVGNISMQDLETLLSFCPNILDLVIWRFPIKSLPPILDKLPLRRLCADFDHFTYEDFLAHPFFVNLTHLHMLTSTGLTWDGYFEALVLLPNLTHLFIECWMTVDVISQLLRHCRLLRILIITPDSIRRYLARTSTEAEINDHRLVILKGPPSLVSVQDWDKGAHGRIDSWAFSELVSLAQSRASFSSFMICLLILLLEYAGNYFVDPPPRYFPRVGFEWEKHLNGKGLEWFAGLHLYDPWPPIEN
jgi:hypothetical protein